jgi:hypothetical protein
VRAVLGATTPFERAAARPAERRPAGAADLRRARRTIVFSLRSAGDVHSRLSPALRAVAGSRLAVNRGIDLEAQPELARRVLGEDLWQAVRADAEAPDDPFSPGMPLERVSELIATLEAL